MLDICQVSKFCSESRDGIADNNNEIHMTKFDHDSSRIDNMLMNRMDYLK